MAITKFEFNYPTLIREHPNFVDQLTWLDSNIQPCYNDGAIYDKGRQFLEWRSQGLETWIIRLQGIPARLKVSFKSPKDKVFYQLRWL